MESASHDFLELKSNLEEEQLSADNCVFGIVVYKKCVHRLQQPGQGASFMVDNNCNKPGFSILWQEVA